jgi:hypothetical protein
MGSAPSDWRLESLMRKTPPTAKPLIKKNTVWVEPTVRR